MDKYDFSYLLGSGIFIFGILTVLYELVAWWISVILLLCAILIIFLSDIFRERNRRGYYG